MHVTRQPQPLFSCSPDATAADSPPLTSSEDQPIAGGFEESAQVALGGLFRIYGTDAGPAPVTVSGEIDAHDGQEIWRLDGTNAALLQQRQLLQFAQVLPKE